MNKLRLIGIVIVVGLVVIGLIAARRKTTPGVSSGATNVAVQIGSNQLAAYTILSDNTVRGLTQTPAQFIRIDPATNAVSEAWPQPNLLILDRISWAPNGEQAIIWYREHLLQPPLVSLIDFTTQSATPLNSGIESVVWAADSQNIYYVFRASENARESSLVKAKPDTRDWEILMSPLPIRFPQLSISPDNTHLAIWTDLHAEEMDELADNYLWLLDLSTRALTPLSDTGAWLTAVWSPDSQQIASLRVDIASFLPSLVVIDWQKQSVVDYDLITLPSKFIWGTTNQIIAASLDQPSAGDLGREQSPTNSLVVQEPTGETRAIVGLQQTFPVTELKLDKTRQRLLFLQNGFLYQRPF